MEIRHSRRLERCCSLSIEPLGSPSQALWAEMQLGLSLQELAPAGKATWLSRLNSLAVTCEVRRATSLSRRWRKQMIRRVCFVAALALAAAAAEDNEGRRCQSEPDDD